MADFAAYEKPEIGSEYNEKYDDTDFRKLVEEEGVFVKEHHREKSKYTNVECVWNVYYIPSKDKFVTSMSSEKDKHLIVNTVSSEYMIKEYKEILKNNNENS